MRRSINEGETSRQNLIYSVPTPAVSFIKLLHLCLDSSSLRIRAFYEKRGSPINYCNVINCSYDSVKLRIIHEMCQGFGIGLEKFFSSPLFDENNLEP